MTRENLLHAYKNALYVARLPHGAVELRVGQPCTALADWLAVQGCTTAAFLTAFNPRSKALPLAENEARHAQLIADIAQLGFAICDGYCTDDGGDWPHEASVLVVGITREQTMTLAEKYQQNAFLFVLQGSEVQLCLTEKFAGRIGSD